MSPGAERVPDLATSVDKTSLFDFSCANLISQKIRQRKWREPSQCSHRREMPQNEKAFRICVFSGVLSLYEKKYDQRPLKITLSVLGGQNNIIITNVSLKCIHVDTRWCS